MDNLKNSRYLLIIFGIRSTFFGDIKTRGILSQVIVFIGGIIQGLIGTGGPLAIIGMKDYLKTKQEIRSSMAIFFIILNILKVIQLITHHNYDTAIFLKIL